MTRKIFILLGHPDAETLSGKFADAYEAGALSADHDVRRQDLGEMQFDPILHKGYKAIQKLEPDLLTFQENVRWCDHLVVVYPNWWSTMPAILKGLIDRAWLPGFAFRFRKEGPLKGVLWDPLLTGKTARIIISANTRGWITWLLFGEFTNELARATLGFAGFRTRVSLFAPSEKASETARTRWIMRVKRLGKRAI